MEISLLKMKSANHAKIQKLLMNILHTCLPLAQHHPNQEQFKYFSETVKKFYNKEAKN